MELDRIVVIIAIFIAIVGIALTSTTLVIRNIESVSRVDEAYEDCLKFLTPSECEALLAE